MFHLVRLSSIGFTSHENSYQRFYANVDLLKSYQLQSLFYYITCSNDQRSDKSLFRTDFYTTLFSCETYLKLTLQHYKHHYQKQPPDVFDKKDVLKKFAKLTRKQLYWSLIFHKVAAFLKMISREYCVIYKNTSFTEHVRATASVVRYSSH